MGDTGKPIQNCVPNVAFQPFIDFVVVLNVFDNRGFGQVIEVFSVQLCVTRQHPDGKLMSARTPLEDRRLGCWLSTKRQSPLHPLVACLVVVERQESSLVLIVRPR